MSKKKQNKTSEVGESLLDLGLAWAVCVQCWGKRGSDGRFVEIETVFIDVLTPPPAGYLFFIDIIAPPINAIGPNTLNGADRSNYHLRWNKNLNHKLAFPSFVANLQKPSLHPVSTETTQTVFVLFIADGGWTKNHSHAGNWCPN